MGVWVGEQGRVPNKVKVIMMLRMRMIAIVTHILNGGHLKWTEGLRSRWVPAGTSYPDSTKS